MEWEFQIPQGRHGAQAFLPGTPQAGTDDDSVERQSKLDEEYERSVTDCHLLRSFLPTRGRQDITALPLVPAYIFDSLHELDKRLVGDYRLVWGYSLSSPSAFESISLGFVPQSPFGLPQTPLTLGTGSRESVSHPKVILLIQFRLILVRLLVCS